MKFYATYKDEMLVDLKAGDELEGQEITEEEYNILLAEIQDKCDCVEAVLENPDNIAMVPEEWQAEVTSRVYSRKKEIESREVEERQKAEEIFQGYVQSYERGVKDAE